MLEFLTKSKIRKKIILLFVHNQANEFYLSEIARLIGASIGTTQREINKLLQNDLILFKKRGGLNIYKLNKKYALLDEVESIIRKTVGVEVELKEALDKIKGISFAFLFGSYVKMGLKSDSDIDLFVVGTADENQVFKAVQSIEKIINRDINYHLIDSKELVEKAKKDYFYKDVLKNYLLIKGNENEFRNLIK